MQQHSACSEHLKSFTITAVIKINTEGSINQRPNIIVKWWGFEKTNSSYCPGWAYHGRVVYALLVAFVKNIYDCQWLIPAIHISLLFCLVRSYQNKNKEVPFLLNFICI